MISPFAYAMIMEHLQVLTDGSAGLEASSFNARFSFNENPGSETAPSPVPSDDALT